MKKPPLSDFLTLALYGLSTSELSDWLDFITSKMQLQLYLPSSLQPHHRAVPPVSLGKVASNEVDIPHRHKKG
jgi:hypothetical protein